MDKPWIILISIALYFLCSVIICTGIYIYAIKEYKKEDSHLKFDYWFEKSYYADMICTCALFWPFVLVASLIVLPVVGVARIIKRKFDIKD